MKKPELLAPAGDYKNLIAAIETDADAMYFGGKANSTTGHFYRGVE